MAPCDMADACVDVLVLKNQRAIRRADSLAKDRAAFRARQECKKNGSGKNSNVSSEIASAVPHRAARAAARNGLARGNIEFSCDMPKISTGSLGNHRHRWERKACVTSMLQQPLGISEPSLRCSRSQREFADADLTIEDQKLEEEGQLILLAATLRARARSLQTQGDTKVVREAPKDHISITEYFLQDKSSLEKLVQPEDETPLAESFSADLSDIVAFPVLSKARKDTSPTVTPTSSDVDAACLSSEEQEEWVVVHEEASASKIVPAAASRLVRRRSSSRKRRGARSGEHWQPEVEMDWSLAGIPREMCKRLINGNSNAAHLGMYAKKDAAKSVPRNAPRPQSLRDHTRGRNAPSRSRSVSRAPSTHMQSSRCR